MNYELKVPSSIPNSTLMEEFVRWQESMIEQLTTDHPDWTVVINDGPGNGDTVAVYQVTVRKGAMLMWSALEMDAITEEIRSRLLYRAGGGRFLNVQLVQMTTFSADPLLTIFTLLFYHH